jgi:hypothetical protein
VRTRAAISFASAVLAICALLLPYKSGRAALFGVSSHVTRESLISYFQIDWASLPADFLLGLVFVPAILVFVKPRASIARTVLYAIMFLLLAGAAFSFMSVLQFAIFEVDVHHLGGFYISAVLAIFAPAYALWLSCRSLLLLRHDRGQVAYESPP